MPGGRFTIYCDKVEDIDLAQRVFTDGPLATADLVLLPLRSRAPDFLQDYVSWERADWIIVRDRTIVAIAELTEHVTRATTGSSASPARFGRRGSESRSSTSRRFRGPG